MTPEQLLEIEERWNPYLDKKAPNGSLGGDFLKVMQEVRRLQGENEKMTVEKQKAIASHEMVHQALEKFNHGDRGHGGFGEKKWEAADNG